MPTKLPGASFEIDGTYLPLDDYGHGDFWDGLYECAGFAQMVYAEMYGDKDNGTLLSVVNFGSHATPLQRLTNILTSLKPGSRITFDYNIVDRDPHTFIVCDIYGSCLVAYDANWDKDNIIYFQEFTYAELANKYITVQGIQPY